MGERTSIDSCIQIYKALTPPAPPSVSRRDGRTWASLRRGILRGATLPRSWAVRYPVRARRCGCGGVGRPPPPDDCTCRVKPRLKSPPPPPPRGPAYGLPRPCAARGAADGLPHLLPCHPLSHCCGAVPALPAHGGEGEGGCAAPGGEGDHPVPDAPDPEQQPLAAPVPAAQHALQHPAAPVRGGVGRHLDPAQRGAALQPPAGRGPGEEGGTLPMPSHCLRCGKCQAEWHL